MPKSTESTASNRMKSPFHTWNELPSPPNQPPIATYGPLNKAWITLRISHGGNLIDMPGREFRKVKVSFLEDVEVDTLNLEELQKISTHLGYKTLGKWYCVNDDPQAGTDFLPLHTEDHIACFVQRAKKNNLQHIEQLYVEQVDPTETGYIPKDVSERSEKRVEKMVYVLLMENPKATVDDGIGFVSEMLGIPVPRSKMEKVMNKARGNLSLWMFFRVGQ